MESGSNKSNLIPCTYSISLFRNGLKALKDREDLERRWEEGRRKNCEQNPALAGCRCLTPVTLATQEAEVRRTAV
jgi:hypothetical protein